MPTIFKIITRLGVLSEEYADGGFRFVYRTEEKERILPLYSICRAESEAQNYYCGYTKDEILSSGKDLLAERLLANGDPDYCEVRSALPPITKNTYTVLSGVSSVSGLTVEPDGKIYHQPSGRTTNVSPLFSPAEFDERLGAIKPYQTLVGGEHPLLLSVHTDGEEALEFLYFVEPTEPDRDPICWIRAKRYRNASPENTTVEYRVAAIGREANEKTLFDNPPTERLFLDALFETISYWVDFSDDGAELSLPEAELERIARGSVSFAALTFTCAHAHYGHRFYGKELHDNFPPNYIFTVEALICLGRQTEAREIFSHFIKYVLRSDGRINYRQGTALNFGASAAEYGMLLHLFGRYKNVLGIDNLTARELKKLCGMGDEIIDHLGKCPELDGHRLIKMCAEADTNERVHVYVNNNLWAIRGLEALWSMLGEKGDGYRLAAEDLRRGITAAMERFEAKNTRFGDLPPFRLGYTATPSTLSHCADTFSPMTAEQSNKYFDSKWNRGDASGEEDLVENTYANYRYYPEMLSSMLLPERYSDSVVRMREGIGGEVMAMTRFMGTVDDWPVLNYARFLIETGRIEKYLLLLYSHATHHGTPSLMTYHEQVSIDGSAVANDCIPSLMTVPLMTAWSFAYETVDGKKLRLLSAIPKDWYSRPFKAKGIRYSEGSIDIDSDGETISVCFSTPPTATVELVWRPKKEIRTQDIHLGAESVNTVRDNVLILKNGIKNFAISVK